MDKILESWYEYKTQPFLMRHARVEVLGIDLVLVDADTAGCIQSFVNSRGHLSPSGILVLQECVDDLAIVVPEVDDEAEEYFQQLYTFAKLVLRDLGL